jgi:hypothetical protein
VDARWQHPYISGMAMEFKLPLGGGAHEAPPERIRREAAVIAEARAEIAAGHGIDDDALEAWLDALDHDENTPLPTLAPIVRR